MTNPLNYTSITLPDDARFKISPSQFSKFIQYPHNWYRSEILEEDLFSHNTASVLGTVIHYCAEMVAKKENIDKNSIAEYIHSLEVKEDYDPYTVQLLYIEMVERLVNDYVLQNEFLEIENTHIVELKNNYYVGGTIDILQGTKEDCMVCDYKSYSSKTKPKIIPAHYKYQLLVYAYILRELGYTVTRVRLIYINRNIEGEISEKTGKRMKSYPPEVTVLTETITDEDFEFIKGLLDLCVDSCEAAIKYPELTHVIFHDPRLKIEDKT